VMLRDSIMGTCICEDNHGLALAPWRPLWDALVAACCPPLGFGPAAPPAQEERQRARPARLRCCLHDGM